MDEPVSPNDGVPQQSPGKSPDAGLEQSTRTKKLHNKNRDRFTPKAVSSSGGGSSAKPRAHEIFRFDSPARSDGAGDMMA
jgi:hypothetical protein